MFVDFRSGIANQTTLVHNNHGFSQILKSDNISLRQTGQIVTTNDHEICRKFGLFEKSI
jgi:hypothetical protein